MNKLLDKISYIQLFLFAILLGLAPFLPLPHSYEKITMLLNGELKKLIDIFDLFFHTSPILLIAIKYLANKNRKLDS